MPLGPRQLRRRFLDVVGIPPKRLARILRFQRLLEEVLACGGKDWTGLALDAGYYDQAQKAARPRASRSSASVERDLPDPGSN